jgi:hypothetical protein
LIYSSDDEWNSYQCSVYTPWTMKVEKKPSYWERFDFDDVDKWDFTCLCMN